MEIINLNLIPTGTRPVVHASQYDNGRQFRANLFEGVSVYTLTGAETLTFSVRKPDGHIVTEGVTNTSDNYVVIETTTQMCACAGDSSAELKIENGDDLIGTLNLILAVEQSPEEGGIQSESEINNLATQVAGMVAEEVATQYDSANVIFDNEPTENHGIGYTVTSEGIKTAIDNAFDYDKTASGSLVHIEDGADNIPVKSFKCAIGSEGFSQADISVCGKNFVSDKIARSTILTDGSIASPDNNHDMFLAEIKQGVTYTIKSDENTSPSRQFVGAFFTSKPTIGSVSYSGTRLADVPATFIAPITGWVAFRASHDYAYAQCEVGNEQTTYEAYNGNTYIVEFGQTFNDGMLAYENGEWFIDESGTITPITSSTRVKTISGVNNIYSNCGDVEVNYYTYKSNDILEFVDSEIGKKNGTNILIEEGSPDSIKDYVDNGLSGKADTSDTYTKTEVDNLLNDKQNKNVLNIVKHYDTGTSSDAITDIITEYGKVNMVFAFDVPLGYFTGCLTFANDNMGSGFIVLSTTGRFWVVSYVSGTITLTELT